MTDEDSGETGRSGAHCYYGLITDRVEHNRTGVAGCGRVIDLLGEEAPTTWMSAISPGSPATGIGRSNGGPGKNTEPSHPKPTGRGQYSS